MSIKGFQLCSDFKPQGDQPVAIQKLVDGLNEGHKEQTLLGVTGSGKTFTLANVIHQINRPTIILAPNKTLAAQLYSEMREFFPHNAVEYFVSYYDYYQPEAYVPASDTFIEKDAAINEQIEQLRLSATKALLERPDTIIVGTVSAIYGLGDPNQYLSMVLLLRIGDTFDQRDILHKLADLQYTRNDVALIRATYRVRGDVIDIFPAESDRFAVRVALFGNEIEKISLFDPLTGEIEQSLTRITIFPKSHYVTPRATVLKAVDAIKSELKTRLKELESNHRLLEVQRLSERTQFDIEMLLELGYCSGIENYSRLLTGRAPGQAPPTLMDYAPPNTLLVLDESHVMLGQLAGMYLGDRSRKETLVEYGFRLPSALDNRPLKYEEFAQISPQTIYVSATPGDKELSQSAQIVEQVVRPTGLIDPEVLVRPVEHQVQDVLLEIKKRTALKERVLITTLTKRMAEDLTEYLSEQGIKVRYLHSDIDTVERVEILRDLRLGEFDVLVGINLLREGLDLPEVSLVAIFDADKEGFLRSTRSLIQTIGRAARHIHGTAILYAANMTRSMEAAIQETDRRRQKQVAYNEAHGITPQSISKKIVDILEGMTSWQTKSKQKGKKSALSLAIPADTKSLVQMIQQKEKQMLQCAEKLEFEKAAALRDELQQLKQHLIE